MKTVTMLVLCLIAHMCFGNSRTEEEKKALTSGAETRIFFCVVDNDGFVVTNAFVKAGFYLNDEKGNAVSGLTDKNGLLLAEKRSVGQVNYWIRKNGYYETSGRIQYYDRSSASVSGGRWQPYGATNTVVLKRIVNPVAMYVEPYTRKIMPPKHNEWIGFDLQANDFVHPNGNGNTADFLVRYDFESGRNVLFYRGEVSLMTTNAFDGIYRMEKDKSSAMTTVYAANTNTTFATEMRFAYNRLIDKVVEDTRLPDNSYLVLRVRSRVDKEGNLVSAHYAKLIGPIEADEGGVWFAYYFNPNENDTNLEADTTKNLLPPHRLGFSP